MERLVAPKPRSSNFELCRLVSILLVMTLHSTYQSLGTDVNFGVMLLEGFTLIGVNCFVLLTGYFSGKPKKQSLLNLAFICLFWMIIKVILCEIFGNAIDYKMLFFVTQSNWFIPSYITLLLFSPILNTFCDTVEKKTLYGVIIALLVAEIWFDWLPPRPVVGIGAQSGYSVLSFIVLYLLARAVRLYDLPHWFKKHSFLIYLICSFSIACMIYVITKLGYVNRVEWVMAYINPILIVSSLAFLMVFENIKIKSNFINHVAKSTLACLLCHSAFFPQYTAQFRYLYENYSSLKLIVYWIMTICFVFIVSILIDQIRIIIWNRINIKSLITKNNIYYGV